MRAIFGLLAGAVAAIAAIVIVCLVAGQFTSVTVPTDPRQSAESAMVALRSVPASVQIILLVSFLAGGFAGAAVAKLIARTSWPGWTVAGLLALLLAGMFLVPLPLWMQGLAVIGPLVGGAVADMMVRGRAGVDGADAPSDART